MVASSIAALSSVRDPGDPLQGKKAQPPEVPCGPGGPVLHTVVEIPMRCIRRSSSSTRDGAAGQPQPAVPQPDAGVAAVRAGGHFARKLLEHEHAQDFAAPPRCGGRLQRNTDRPTSLGSKGEWSWRCYGDACPQRSPNGRTNLNTPAPKLVITRQEHS